MIDEFAVRWRAGQLVHKFGRRVVAAKGMVGAVENAARSQDLVAAFKRLEVITDGISVKLAQIIIDGICWMKPVIGRRRQGGIVSCDTSFKIREDTSTMGHNQVQIGSFVEQAALDEA